MRQLWSDMLMRLNFFINGYGSVEKSVAGSGKTGESGNSVRIFQNMKR